MLKKPVQQGDIVSLPGPQPSGRLELTWTNKSLRLLAHENGRYEWTERGDHRVAEVRLLHETGCVGEAPEDGPTNLLIRGDALHALSSLAKLPSYAQQYAGKVRLAYLDPPFNTGQAFEHYDDALEHSVWLTMMRDRLVQIRDLLSKDGSVWVHLDDSEVAYCRILMDEVFGRENFVSTIVWETDQGRRNDTDISTVQDYVLVFARNKQAWRPTRNLLPRTAEQTKRYRNPDNDPRGPWLQGADGTARSGSDALLYPITTPSGKIVRPPSGAFWRFSQETFARALEESRVYFGADGAGMPIIKRYLTDVQDGVVPRTWWPAAEVGSNMSAKRDHLRRLFPDKPAFATPKPETLLQRILSIATNPGDLVLDCFLGSGTTAAVATKMGRRWVGIEASSSTMESYTAPRLKMVQAGEDPWGITSDVKWAGGGHFRELEVAPSMYEVVGGRVVLARWATGGALAEAICAQGRWTYAEEPPFCGRKGSVRLAVVDGLVSVDVALLLAGWLEPDEQLVIYGTAVDPAAQKELAEAYRGSTVKQVPQSLLADYRREWRNAAPDWVSFVEGDDVPLDDVELDDDDVEADSTKGNER